MNEDELLELRELEELERLEAYFSAQPVEQPWQPMPQTGSMSDFSEGTGTPNPDKWMARIPVDVAMAYGTGGAANAVAKLHGMIANFPRLAKIMGYAGQALTKPKTIGQAGVGGAIEGGLTEAKQPDATLESVAGQTAMGMGAGAIGDAILKPLTGGLKVNERAQNLLDHGVELTTGARISRGVRNAEDKMMSVPFLGDSIREAKNREQSSFNKALINESLDPIGSAGSGRELVPSGVDSVLPGGVRLPGGVQLPGRVQLPGGIKPGADSMRFAKDTISKGYDEVLDTMTVKPDAQFIAEITKLRGMVDMLPEREAKRFNQVVDNSINHQFGVNDNLLLGKTYKKVYTKLRTEAKKFRKSADPYQQDLGTALGEVMSSLEQLGVRQNPLQGEALANLDKSYAKHMVNVDASALLGASDRSFGASQYLNSIAKNTDKGRFATGEGFNQQLAEDAKHIMSQEVNDSGTAGRLIASGLVTGGTVVANPGLTIPAIGVGMMAYSKPGQKMLNGLLFKSRDNVLRNNAAALSGLFSAATATEVNRQ